MKQGWQHLLAPHRPYPAPDTVTVNEPAAPAPALVELIFDTPLPEQETLHDLLLEGGLLEDAILGFGDDIALPLPVTVRFTPCADANAYWSRSRAEVQICYELIEEFDAIHLDMALR